MRIRCPGSACGRTVEWTERQCSGCGLVFTPKNLIAAYWRRLKSRFRVTCPACRHDAPLSASRCPKCAAPLNLAAGYAEAMQPLRQRLLRTVAGWSTTQLLWILRGYALFSLLVFWGLVRWERELFSANDRATNGLILVLLLPVCIWLVLIIVPVKVRRWLVTGTTGWFRLALVLNLGCTLMGLHILTGVFQADAKSVAYLVFVFVAGGYLFLSILRPFWLDLADAWLEPDRTHFDPLHSQGRKINVDLDP